MPTIPRQYALYLTVAAVLLLAGVTAEKHVSSMQEVAAMSVADIEQGLQSCRLVQNLNAYKAFSSPPTSSFSSRVFAILFPGSPAVNALLATLYISGPPNFLLALCPPNIDPASLSVMVAFAVGGLLGDTLFHLLPEIFLGEVSPEHERFVMVEPNKNLLLGVAIMAGFVTFVAMDKILRIATGGQGHDHSHSHASKDEDKASAVTSALPAQAGTTIARKKGDKAVAEVKTTVKEIDKSVQLAGYLNLM